MWNAPWTSTGRPGPIGVEWYLYMRMSNGVWGVCFHSDRFTNTVWTTGLSVSKNFGTKPPCGNGYYQTYTKGSANLVGEGGYAVFGSGDVWSGAHHLPA